MARLPRLEIISTFGVGYDHIETKWAGEHGVTVTNTPGVATKRSPTPRSVAVVHRAGAAAGRAVSAPPANGWRRATG
jgi:hypothetical protein